MGSSDALPISADTLMIIGLIALLGILLATWLERAEAGSPLRRIGYLTQTISFMMMAWVVLAWWATTRWGSFADDAMVILLGLVMMAACWVLPSALNEDYEYR